MINIENVMHSVKEINTLIFLLESRDLIGLSREEVKLYAARLRSLAIDADNLADKMLEYLK